MTDRHYSTLVLRGTGIRRDNEGRFCLNDLHRASGSAPNKKPSNWLRYDTAKELVLEISGCSNSRFQPVNIIRGGAHQGTYVARELVYAYAMWISPTFHLAVIRAFDAQMTNQPIQAQPAIRFRSMDSAFRQMMKVALLCGATRRVAMERAAEAVKRHWGVNPLHEMGLVAEPAPRDGLLDLPNKEDTL